MFESSDEINQVKLGFFAILDFARIPWCLYRAERLAVILIIIFSITPTTHADAIALPLALCGSLQA